MKTILAISHAVSIAFHAAVLMAAYPLERLSNKFIAAKLNVSESHSAKVLQKLSKSGLAVSNRGAKGGFTLIKSGDEITLLDVYESIEGPFISKNCILDTPVCSEFKCIFGDLLISVGKQVYMYMSETKLSDLSGFYDRGETEKKDNEKNGN